MNFITGDVSDDSGETKIQCWQCSQWTLLLLHFTVSLGCLAGPGPVSALEVRGGRKLRTGEKVEVGQGQEETHRKEAGGVRI